MNKRQQSAVIGKEKGLFHITVRPQKCLIPFIPQQFIQVNIFFIY